MEILQETGIRDARLVRRADIITIPTTDHIWKIFPFLFDVDRPDITLNWENSEYCWIAPRDISGYRTVPGLDKVLACLL